MRPVAATAAPRRRVLICDDEVAVGVSLARLLRLRGVQSVVCGTAAEALARLEVEPFDALVADDNLDRAGAGRELLAAARGRFPSLRLLLMTGGGHAVSPDAAHACLRKPFDVDDLVAAIAGEGSA